MDLPYQVEPDPDNDTLVIKMHDVKEGWAQEFLLTSDWHRDSAHFNERLFHRHMKEAREKRAGIFSFGDDHDLMQAKGDPRGSYEELLTKYKTDDYADAIVEDAVEELFPYRDWFLMFSRGNHGDSFQKRHGTNVTRRVANELGAHYMGWAGWIEFKFARNGGGSGRSTQNWWFEHGSGGGGKASRGLQYASYRAAYLPDANGILSGHIHWTWLYPHKRFRKSRSGRGRTDIQWHASLPTYKDEFDPKGGFHMTKGREPRPIGGIWLKFFYDPTQHGRVGVKLEHAIE